MKKSFYEFFNQTFKSAVRKTLIGASVLSCLAGNVEITEAMRGGHQHQFNKVKKAEFKAEVDEAETLSEDYMKKVRQFADPIVIPDGAEIPQAFVKSGQDMSKIYVFTPESIIRGCFGKDSERYAHYMRLVDAPTELKNVFHQTLLNNAKLAVIRHISSDGMSGQIIANSETLPNYCQALVNIIETDFNSEKIRSVVCCFLAALEYRKDKCRNFELLLGIRDDDGEGGSFVGFDADSKANLFRLYLVFANKRREVLAPIICTSLKQLLDNPDRKFILASHELCAHELGHAVHCLLGINRNGLVMEENLIVGLENAFVAKLICPTIDAEDFREIWHSDIFQMIIQECLDPKESVVQKMYEFLANVKLELPGKGLQDSFEKKKSKFFKYTEGLTFWYKDDEILQIIGILDCGNGYLVVNNQSDLDYSIERSKPVRWFHLRADQQEVESASFPAQEYIDALMWLHTEAPKHLAEVMVDEKKEETE